MTTLLVRGLEDEGAGDIVGASVNEAGIEPDAIGEIDFDGSEATVEVDGTVADRVLEAMDGGRIGRAEVSVDWSSSSAKRRCAATRKRSGPSPAMSARRRAVRCWT